MNKYPTWWNSTVTIYNRYENPETQQVSWYRTVLTNCFWKINVATSSFNSDMSRTYSNAVLCRIPKNDKYLSTQRWKLLDEIKRASKFTLQVGDIVVNGKVTDDIDEYTKGKHSSDIVSKYKDMGIIKIEAVADSSDEARLIPHYAVSRVL